MTIAALVLGWLIFMAAYVALLRMKPRQIGHYARVSITWQSNDGRTRAVIPNATLHIHEFSDPPGFHIEGFVVL